MSNQLTTTTQSDLEIMRGSVQFLLDQMLEEGVSKSLLDQWIAELNLMFGSLIELLARDQQKDAALSLEAASRYQAEQDLETLEQALKQPYKYQDDRVITMLEEQREQGRQLTLSMISGNLAALSGVSFLEIRALLESAEEGNLGSRDQRTLELLAQLAEAYAHAS